MERYLATRILRPTLVILALLGVVAAVHYANRFLADAVAERLPLDLVAAMSALKLALLLDTLLPAAAALGIAVGLGRLQAGHEIAAMAAAGLGRGRMLRGVLWPVLLLAALTALQANLFRPWGYQQLYRMQTEAGERFGLDRLQPGRFESLGRNWVVFAESRSGGTLSGAVAHRRVAGAELLFRADTLREAMLPDDRRQLLLEGDVRAYKLDRVGAGDLVASFQRLSLDYFVPPRPGRNQLRRAEPLSALLASDDPYYHAELQWRLLGPLSALVLALTALALSRVDPRQGQGIRVLAVSLTTVLWFSLLGVATNWLEQARIPPSPGLFWLPLVALTALGARLYRLARRPGPLL